MEQCRKDRTAEVIAIWSFCSNDLRRFDDDGDLAGLLESWFFRTASCDHAFDLALADLDDDMGHDAQTAVGSCRAFSRLRRVIAVGGWAAGKVLGPHRIVVVLTAK